MHLTPATIIGASSSPSSSSSLLPRHKTSLSYSYGVSVMDLWATIVGALVLSLSSSPSTTTCIRKLPPITQTSTFNWVQKVKILHKSNLGIGEHVIPHKNHLDIHPLT
ncbi:hypothetical protein M0R45_036693 [Rubus argutus]|uniref:Uncharacterized protein n=1 Tax=Rubus argutus TaxID=59490 RepID=A0AAW1W0Z5_RUBAR